MKSKDSIIRLRKFSVDEKRQKVADMESMINDFKRMADDLNLQIDMEQKRAGITDVNHFSYPTFAKAAVQRRDNLIASVTDLEDKLDLARGELASAFEELKKLEKIEEREIGRERAHAEAVEQTELDELAMTASMRLI